VQALSAELDQAREDARSVARNYEQEAAAREEERGLAAELEAKQQELSAQTAELADENRKLADERSSIGERLERATVELRRLQAARSDAEGAIGALEGERERLREEVRELRRTVEEAQSQAHGARLDALSRSAEAWARHTAAAEVRAAVLEPVEAPELPRRIDRPADLEAVRRSRAAAGVRSREAALAQAPTSEPAAPLRASRQRARATERRPQSQWLPSETLLGVFLLVFGLTVAVLILTGVVKLGFSP
jgi:DNA repair exonuclease SbcCD ATPase subunit